jgi:WD40 repeat protein
LLAVAVGALVISLPSQDRLVGARESTQQATRGPVPQHVILTTDAGEITFLAASADGRYLAAASLDSHVFLWETSEWKQVASVSPEPPPKAAQGEHQDEYSAIEGLAFSPDNHTVAFASEGILFTFDTRSRIKRVRGRTDAESLAFTPDGTKLIATTANSSVEIWDTRMWRRRIIATPLFQDPNAVAGAISISSDGSYAAISGDGGVGILDLDTLVFTMLPPPTDAPKRAEGGYQIGISADNRFVASGVTAFESYRLVVWDVVNKAVVFSAKTERGVWAVAFSQDRKVLFAGQSMDKIIGWKTTTWNEACTLDSEGQYQFAVGARWLAAGGGTQTITIIPLQECTSN